MARYVAKNIVGAGLARECEVQVAYAIGRSEPVAVNIDTYGTGRIPDDKLCALARNEFDFRPLAIIEQLDLRKPIYKPLSCYGHFGRVDLDLSWEKRDRADELQALVSD